MTGTGSDGLQAASCSRRPFSLRFHLTTPWVLRPKQDHNHCLDQNKDTQYSLYPTGPPLLLQALNYQAVWADDDKAHHMSWLSCRISAQRLRGLWTEVHSLCIHVCKWACFTQACASGESWWHIRHVAVLHSGLRVPPSFNRSCHTCINCRVCHM